MSTDIAGSSEEKRVLKYAPGRKYDDLYYNNQNSKVQLIEAVATFGKYQINLPGANYNTTTPITFPNLNFIGKTYINFRIRKPTTFASNSYVLTNGWGLALINSVEMLIGNSNIGSQRIDRTSMYHSMVASAQVAEGLKYNFDTAGDHIAGFNFVNDAQANYITINQECDAVGAQFLSCNVILDLPFSNYCGAEGDKLYFDTSLLTAPITLNITLNGPNTIWGTNVPVFGSSDFTATLFYRQVELTNRNQSLRATLFSAPGAAVSYPSLYRQSFVQRFTPGIVGDLTSGAFSSPQFDLTSFLNSDLLGMSISLHLLNDVNPTITAGGDTYANPWHSLPFFAPFLTFGGEPIYKAPGYSWRLCNQESCISAVYYDNAVDSAVSNCIDQYTTGPTPISVAGPLTMASRDYVLFIDFSRLRAFCNNSGELNFPNTIRLPKQVLQLTMNMPPYETLLNGNSAFMHRKIAGQPCLLNAVYYYPQVTEVNSTGSVNIFYN